jgi:hypothetical protein
MLCVYGRMIGGIFIRGFFYRYKRALLTTITDALRRQTLFARHVISAQTFTNVCGAARPHQLLAMGTPRSAAVDDCTV